MSHAPAAAPRSRFWGPFLSRVGLGTLVVALFLGLLWWWSLQSIAHQGQDHLCTVLAETDVRWPRWRWDAVVQDRPTIPDDRNSWFVLERFQASVTRPMLMPGMGLTVPLADSPATNRLLDAA